MCGRFTATAAFDVLADRFGIEVVDADTKELLGRFNVAPAFRLSTMVTNRIQWDRFALPSNVQHPESAIPGMGDHDGRNR